MLGSVNWCCISTTKICYYCSVQRNEQRFAEQGCVVVAGQVSRISMLAQCLTSVSLEQYLISGILEQYLIRNSGTMFDQELENNI